MILEILRIKNSNSIIKQINNYHFKLRVHKIYNKMIKIVIIFKKFKSKIKIKLIQ